MSDYLFQTCIVGHSFVRSDCADCREARRRSFQNIRDLCKSLGLEYMRREPDGRGTFIRVPDLPRMRDLIAISDTDLSALYLKQIQVAAAEAKALATHHLHSRDSEHAPKHRRTLCGREWPWHVAAAWVGRVVVDPRDGGCMHCRVMLDKALEQDQVTVTVSIEWKSTV